MGNNLAELIKQCGRELDTLNGMLNNFTAFYSGAIAAMRDKVAALDQEQQRLAEQEKKDSIGQ